MTTLKQINSAIKRIDRTIQRQLILVKEGVPSPYLVALEAQRNDIIASLKRLTDPKNAVRNSLPKKSQRLAGILPKV